VIPALVSYLVWGFAALALLAFEIVAVVTERKTGLLPLTRIVRDRLMKRSRPIRLLVLFALVWLPYHFFLEGPVVK
jgi:hypothetical protein